MDVQVESNRYDIFRLEVENAEDDLVQKTEVAIQMMKTVLSNPEPLKNLNELVKAQVCTHLRIKTNILSYPMLTLCFVQLLFHSQAAETLAAVQGEIEELSVTAEAQYR